MMCHQMLPTLSKDKHLLLSRRNAAYCQSKIELLVAETLDAKLGSCAVADSIWFHLHLLHPLKDAKSFCRLTGLQEQHKLGPKTS